MGIFDELKSIAGTLQEAGKIEQYKQILDALKELLEMRNKIFDLEAENKVLKQKIQTNEDLVSKNDAYWTKSNDGPFCLTCHGAKGLLIRMVSLGEGQHRCNNCNHVVTTDPAAFERLQRQQEAEYNQRNRNPYI